MRRENERGEFFVIDTSVHLEERHGDVPLSRCHTIAPDTVSVLAAEPDLAGFDLREAVFLDTETTGLAGGAGTAAFLIGAGWVEGDRFRVRQYFMRDYHEEAALLRGARGGPRRLLAHRDLQRKGLRRAAPRHPLPSQSEPLRPRRRRPTSTSSTRRGACGRSGSSPAACSPWRWRCSGLRRTGDIPGSEIPQVYFDWVRRRDARLLARVFEHNRQDIVSLAALAVLACQWVEESRAEDPRDVYSLARVLERARLYEQKRGRVPSSPRARRRLPAGAGAPPSRVAGQAGPGLRAGGAASGRRRGEAGEPEGWRELAMHHEHRTRDLDAALRAVERGMRLVGEGTGRAVLAHCGGV